MAQVQTQPAPRTEPIWASTAELTGGLVPVARVFFSAIFILSGLHHFSQELIDVAAAHGVPMVNVAVPLSGVIAVAGGVSILLGLYARLGAWLLVLFLVPVTLTMHAFWT